MNRKPMNIHNIIPILVSCMILLGLGCQNTSTEEDTSGTPATAAADNSSSSTNDDQLTGTRQAYVPPKANQSPLTLGVANERVKSGEDICLNVQVADFNQLLSMQYSVRWDPQMLQFIKTDGYQLGGLGPEDFGAHRTAEGILTAVWIDDNLQGVTVADGATIYQICFKAIGAAGQNTEVSFSDGPTPFEVVNLKEEVLDLKGVAGRVTIN